MGFENFGVSLEGGSATAEQTIQLIDGLEGVSRSHGLTTGSTYFLRADGKHVIEIELMHVPLWISCRFTLCHPPSVDAAFLEWIRVLLDKTGMQVRIRDDVTPEHAKPFSLDQFEDFSKACLPYIAARRREWKLAFGERQLAATTVEAHQHIISAHYLNAVEKAS